MKILLIGEYSRLHNSLKEGLQILGHHVIIIADGDHFKKFDVDFSIRPAFFSDNLLTRKLAGFCYKVFKIDLIKLERAYRFYSFLPQLKNFDAVQLINSDAIETYPIFSKYLLKKIFSQNKKKILLVCGDETPIIDFLLRDELQYSILTPFLNNPNLKKEFQFPLKYTQKNYRSLFEFVLKNTSAIITSDLDYKIPMERTGFQTTLIPNPVNVEKTLFEPLEISEKIILFLGINTGSCIKKGTIYFENALEIISKKYPEQVEIIITRNIPYSTYINIYNKAHILLDQVYGFDQGYNALEAMAKGKVVFTGAEAEFTEYYNLTERVAVNALPDVEYLVSEISFLIENPQEIIKIGKQAKAFIDKEHNYIKIAQKYLDIWNKN
ncbi:glycosyltransferase [Flavobacterium hydrophilum]|uniref:Glycosyl transferase family 1 n=1 Tax=Flavobacterium hydrophilum TaxID=2211445 RepID=A0A2V4CBD2_9FLAO|nr:glycosyltransferase [Flavobacterium hydrophilum]PXY43454.1 glycosyl transferase family 1 [Flavobacterium hydrophilum]